MPLMYLTLTAGKATPAGTTNEAGFSCIISGTVVTAPAAPPVSAVKEKVPDKKVPEKTKETVQKSAPKQPASRTQTLVIAGVVGLVIVAALAYFVLLPMLSGTGTTSAATSGSPLTNIIPPAVAYGTPVQGSVPSSTASGQSATSALFVTEPTQAVPTDLLVTYQAERDPITGIVTVTFTGGAGKNGVSDVFIRLTRSDGQVLTRSFLLRRSAVLPRWKGPG